MNCTVIPTGYYMIKINISSDKFTKIYEETISNFVLDQIIHLDRKSSSYDCMFYTIDSLSNNGTGMPQEHRLKPTNPERYLK